MNNKFKTYFNELWRLSFLYFIVIALLWVPWHFVGEIFDAVENKADIVKIYGHLFMMLLALIVPVVNIIGVIELRKPGALNRGIIGKIGVGKLLLIFVGGLIVLSFHLRNSLMDYVKNNGYVYCEEMSESTTFSNLYVFARNGVVCESTKTLGCGDENED